ncbi:apoptotic chromatin condensation inducer in the nucleus-like [Watersipora subatra]|uniref:apoptotic chromatin condensation inducer in the nucleus-like n=1 Tax=Watersipora subatra TaxID=2589382 RepID=UPI00355BDC8D
MADAEQLRIGGKLLKDLRVKDLKEELDNRGLSKAGSKNQLLARLKSQLQLEKLQSQPAPDQLPDVNDGADTDNEFVKHYLEQRQKLFEAQKEARRKIEEEEKVRRQSGDGVMPSESESQEDDSQTEPESPVKETHSSTPSKREVEQKQSKEEAPRRSSRRTTSQTSVYEEREASPRRKDREASPRRKPLEDLEESADDVYNQKTPEPAEIEPTTGRDDMEPSDPQGVVTDNSINDEQKPELDLPKHTKSDLKQTPLADTEASKHMVEEEKSSGGKELHEMNPSKMPENPPVQDKSSGQKESFRRRLQRIGPSESSGSIRKEENAQQKDDSGKSVTQTEKLIADKPMVSIDDGSAPSKKPAVVSTPDVDPESCKMEEENSTEGREASREGLAKSPAPVTKAAEAIEKEPTATIPALDIATTEQDEQLDYDEELPQEQVEPKKVEVPEPAPVSPPRKEPTIPARKIIAKGRLSKGERLSRDERESRDERSTHEEGKKKRRWGASSKSKKDKSISISTDSLKEVMPTLRTIIDREEMNGVSSDAQPASPEIVEVEPQSPKVKIARVSSPKESEPITEKAEGDVGELKSGNSSQQDGHTLAAKEPVVKTASAEKAKVRVSTRHAQDEVVLSTDEDLSDGEITMVKKVEKPAHTITLPVEEPVRVREKVSPPRNTLNATIHIQNLTRPFTIGQLKELLSKHGELSGDEGAFWIDKIKSHCYATFQDASSAEAARKTLHGSRWPPSNPKVLRVEYGSMDELAFRKDRYEAQLQGIPLESQKRKEESEAARQKARQEALEARRLKREKEEAERQAARDAREERRKKNERQPSPPAREWDKHKLRQSASPPMPERRGSRRESRRESRERRESSRGRGRDGGERKRRDEAVNVIEEKPVVSLDDLFRKTVAEPAIYWLPLTDEKIAENERLAEERAAERKAFLEKREEEAREQQAKAAERRREMMERAAKERERNWRRPARSRSPRRRQPSRSPVRRRRRSPSSSNSSSSRSRSRRRVKRSPAGRGSPSPKRPARSSPSPRRPVRRSRSPKRNDSSSPRRPVRKSPSPRRPARRSPSPRRLTRRSPSPKRPTKAASQSGSRSRSRNRSHSKASKESGMKEKRERSMSGSPPRHKRSRSGSNASSASSSSGSSSGSGSASSSGESGD